MTIIFASHPMVMEMWKELGLEWESRRNLLGCMAHINGRWWARFFSLCRLKCFVYDGQVVFLITFWFCLTLSVAVYLLKRHLDRVLDNLCPHAVLCHGVFGYYFWNGWRWWSQLRATRSCSDPLRTAELKASRLSNVAAERLLKTKLCFLWMADVVRLIASMSLALSSWSTLQIWRRSSWVLNSWSDAVCGLWRVLVLVASHCQRI